MGRPPLAELAAAYAAYRRRTGPEMPTALAALADYVVGLAHHLLPVGHALPLAEFRAQHTDLPVFFDSVFLGPYAYLPARPLVADEITELTRLLGGPTTSPRAHILTSE